MKILFSLLLVLAVSAQTLFGAYLLPIGSNVDNRPAKVGIALGGYGTRLEDTFLYEPKMGELEAVVESHVRKLADSFTPPIPETPDAYLYVTVEPGPYYIVEEFRFLRVGDRWVAPKEVLDVKLEYGKNTAWRIAGVTSVEMEVRLPDRVERFSSSEGGPGISPCFLGNQQGGLGEGWVLVENTYALPWLQKERSVQEGSTITLLENNKFATFNLLDGSVIGYSETLPAFLESFKVSEPLRVVLGRSTNGEIEISLSGDGTESAGIEESSDMVRWTPLYGTVVPSGAVRTLRFSPTGGYRFFRARVDAAPQ